MTKQLWEKISRAVFLCPPKRLSVLPRTPLRFFTGIKSLQMSSQNHKKIREPEKSSLIVCHTDDAIIPGELLQKDKRQHKFHILCKRPD